MSLYLALIEGARSNAIRLEAQCVMDIGLNSVLAEYHRVLQERYNLFALDSSYGTSLAGRGRVEERLAEYMSRNFSAEEVSGNEILFRDFLGMSVAGAEMTGVSILSDGGGEVFRRRAVEVIKEEIGIALPEKVLNWMETVEVNALTERDISFEKAQVDRQIQSYHGKEVQISKEEWKKVEVVNPTEGLEALRRSGILKTVLEHPDQVSPKIILEEELIASRMSRGSVSTGNLFSEEPAAVSGTTEKLFFQEYLLKYMKNYIGAEKEMEKSALDYQVEYLIAGDPLDVNNLRMVVNRICALREVSNVLYLYSDEVKCAEAEVLASGIAALMLLPEISPLLKHTLLLGWAYGESIYDVKMLLAGGKVPLLKDAASWHCGLQEALAQEERIDAERSRGLSYEDYLRILMCLEDVDTLTARAMNIVEADIRLTEGNEAFRLDACYDCVELRVGIVSSYGYAYEITRRKKY